MDKESGFDHEQGAPIKEEVQLEKLEEELQKIFREIDHLIESFNKKYGRIVIPPRKPGSRDVSTLRVELYIRIVNWPYLEKLIDQALEIKEKQRLIRYDTSVDRKAKQSRRQEKIMKSIGWKKVFENDRLKPKLFAKSQREGSLSELEEEHGEDEIVEESEKS